MQVGVYKNKILLGLASVIVMACNTDRIDPNPERIGWDYFPLEIGLFIDYEVDEVRFSVLGEQDTIKYYMRMEVVDSFTNQSGQKIFIWHRFLKDSLEEIWDFDRSIPSFRDTGRAVVTEENIPLIKLSFPIEENKSWNGNALNVKDEDVYQFANIRQPIILPNGESFNQTVTILQSDNQDFIVQLDTRIETYALGVGLIYRKVEDLRYCTDPACFGLGEVETGLLQTIQAINYGLD